MLKAKNKDYNFCRKISGAISSWLELFPAFKNINLATTRRPFPQAFLIIVPKTFGHAKTPSLIPGQRCPENFEISSITEVRMSNFCISDVAEDIDELLSYSEDLVF